MVSFFAITKWNEVRRKNVQAGGFNDNKRFIRALFKFDIGA